MKPNTKTFHDEFITWSNEKINAAVAKALGCKPTYNAIANAMACNCSSGDHASGTVSVGLGEFILVLKPYSTSADAALEAVEGIGMNDTNQIKYTLLHDEYGYQVILNIKQSSEQWIKFELPLFKTSALALCFAVIEYARIKEEHESKANINVKV